MTIDEIRSLDIEAVEARLAAIAEEMETDGADIQALDTEADALNERRAAIKADAEQRAALAAKVAGGAGETVRELRGLEDMKMSEEKKSYTVDSPEYRKAFLEHLRGAALPEEMRAAYVGTTGDTTPNNHGMGLLVPTTMLNRIWDLVAEQHTILGDITMYRTNTYLTIPLHTAIAQGDAAAISENTAATDEINNFTTVTLHGVDYAKTVKISYAMAQMSIDALETYLTNEIAARLGAAMAKDTITGILTDYYTTDATFTAYSSTVKFADIAKAFGALKNPNGGAVVYATNKTIYNYLVGMVDSAGRPIFQHDANEGAQGRLIGYPVKVEDALSDDVILVGYPKNVVGNVVQDVMVETARDIEKHVIVYSGYARYESKLIAPKSFAKIAVTASAAE